MAKVYLKEVREAVRDTIRVVSFEDMIEAHRRSELKRLSLELKDYKFAILPIETWQLFLQWSGVDKIKYVNEFMDCDDFADILVGECKKRLKVNGIGKVVDVSGGHCL